MMQTAVRLKDSIATMKDPEAGQLFEELAARIVSGEYAVFYNKIINSESAFDKFINVFLQSLALIKSETGEILPTHNPAHIAYSNTKSHPDKGKMEQWCAYWSNCFITLTTYEEDENDYDLIFSIEKDLYEKAIKAKAELQ